ncbi:MAG: hypothetical protein ACLRH1_04205 [Acutalibacteraceae bacterium]
MLAVIVSVLVSASHVKPSSAIGADSVSGLAVRPPFSGAADGVGAASSSPVSVSGAALGMTDGSALGEVSDSSVEPEASGSLSGVGNAAPSSAGASPAAPAATAEPAPKASAAKAVVPTEQSRSTAKRTAAAFETLRFFIAKSSIL